MQQVFGRGFVAVLLGGAMAVVGAPAAVHAGDIWDWSGFYAGGHVGYGSGTVDGSYAATEEDFAKTTETTPRYYFGTDPPQVELAPSHIDYLLFVYANIPRDQILTFEPTGDIDGFLAGAQAGYNWQDGSVVYGLEASVSSSDISGTAEFSNVYPGSPDVLIDGAFTADLNWVAMLRGKLGFAVGQVMPYVAGGLAVGQVDIDGSIVISSAQTSKTPVGESSSTQIGLTASAGVEVAVSENMSVFAEYGYTAFKPFEVEVGDGANFAFNLDSQLVRTGVNFSF